MQIWKKFDNQIKQKFVDSWESSGVMIERALKLAKSFLLELNWKHFDTDSIKSFQELRMLLGWFLMLLSEFSVDKDHWSFSELELSLITESSLVPIVDDSLKAFKTHFLFITNHESTRRKAKAEEINKFSGFIALRLTLSKQNHLQANWSKHQRKQIEINEWFRHNLWFVVWVNKNVNAKKPNGVIYMIMHLLFSAQGLFFLSTAWISGSFFSFSSINSRILKVEKDN